jgi:hypothetical protein
VLAGPRIEIDADDGEPAVAAAKERHLVAAPTHGDTGEARLHREAHLERLSLSGNPSREQQRQHRYDYCARTCDVR